MKRNLVKNNATGNGFTPKPGHLSKRRAELPGQVESFCQRRRIRNELAAAIAFVNQSFDSNIGLTVGVDNDPEEGGEWIVIEITSASTVEEFLRAYKRCIDLWVSQLPPKALALIRLSYSLR